MNTKRTISILAICAALTVISSPSFAQANSCAEKAMQIAKQQNAELLSAQSKGGKCVIKMRIASKDGKPPRIVEQTVDG